MNRPFIVVLEGMDGVGKRTQAELLMEYFIKEKGIKQNEILLMSFPNYKNNNNVKKVLDNKIHIPKHLFSDMFMMDRAFYFLEDVKYKGKVMTRLEQIQQKYKVIIFDRFVGSNFLYNTFSEFKIKRRLSKEEKEYNNNIKNIFLDEVEAYQHREELYYNVPKVDITLFLDLPVKLSNEMLMHRYKGDESKLDINEKNNNLKENVRIKGKIMCEHKDWTRIICSKIEWSQPEYVLGIYDIHDKIIKEVNKKYKKYLKEINKGGVIND